MITECVSKLVIQFIIYAPRIASAQLLSHVQLFATRWNAAHQASLSITKNWLSKQFVKTHINYTALWVIGHRCFIASLFLLQVVTYLMCKARVQGTTLDSADVWLFFLFAMPMVFLILLTAPVVSLGTLCTLFTELRVDKPWAERLEGDWKSWKNCRHVYSFLSGTQPLSWLAQQR